MISRSLLLSVMAVVATQAAPQISERQVVGDVLAQLGPSIERAIASLGGGGSRSFSTPSRFSTSSVSAAPVRTSYTSSIPTTRFSPSYRSGPSRSSYSSIPTGSTRATYSSGSSSPSVSSVTSSVVSSLQPSIAAAVAQALAGSQSRSTGRVSNQEDFEGPASYDYSYKVADDEAQAYIAHQENREGEIVTGSYNYVDPTGSLVTVNYNAGPDGYTQTRDVQKGAVEMRNIPVGWDGPLAGIDDVGAVATRGSARPSGVSQSDLIAQILASIQPKITSAVQSAVSSNSGTAVRASGLGQTSFTGSRRLQTGSNFGQTGSSFGQSGSSFGSNQGGLVRTIISSLQPRISSAVNSAISSSRPVAAPRSRPRTSYAPATQTGGNLAGLFGAPGQTSFRLETPEIQIQY